MHEVINFSCSQASGHLITQLYNVQESHLPYTQKKTLTHSNDVFLVPRKNKGRTNYYPRSLNVEFSGGFGSLGKHEYAEVQTVPETYKEVVIERQKRHVKTEFQLNLDAGKLISADLLTLENTHYWTDYNKLIYRPESLISLGGFDHPQGTHKHFPRLRFSDFHVGIGEFKPVSDEIDDFFRRNLELLDQIMGVSFFSECDSAWSGFTSEMMVFLRDEYFGNGVSSKHNLWTYGLMPPSGGKPPKIENMLTRVRALTEFASNSTLFMPLCAPGPKNGFLGARYEPHSLWHQGAAESLFVSSLWGLNCQAESPVSMATIENNLLRGNSRRNIVNEITLRLVHGIASDVSIMDMYLNAGQNRVALGTDESGKNNSILDLGFTRTCTEPVFSKGVISKRHPDLKLSNLLTDLYVNPYMDEITKSDTFPAILQSPDFDAEFSQSAGLQPLLKEYRKIVQKVKLPLHMDILGDKAEIVEALSHLVDEYSAGYADESDIDD